MLLSLAAAALTSSAAAAPPDLARDATEWVLSGEDLPDDYLQRLAGLPPDERLLAIVFLRRAGLLTGAAMSVEALLAPAPPEDPDTAETER